MSHLLGKNLLLGLCATHEQVCSRLVQYPSGICTCLQNGKKLLQFLLLEVVALFLDISQFQTKPERISRTLEAKKTLVDIRNRGLQPLLCSCFTSSIVN